MRALVFLSALLGLSYSVISNRNFRRRCFHGWIQFEQDCYKPYRMRARFMEAENKCKEVGGHLTSIHSPEENDFLRGLTSTGHVQENRWDNNVWIGFFYEKQSETWKWLDGSPTDYTNWATKEPNFMDYDSEYQASMMPDSSFDEKDHPGNWYNPDGGQWNNLHDMPLRGFVCKQKKSSMHI
ncbi:unnamed protein product [Caenorhabditis nigoni]